MSANRPKTASAKREQPLDRPGRAQTAQQTTRPTADQNNDKQVMDDRGEVELNPYQVLPGINHQATSAQSKKHEQAKSANDEKNDQEMTDETIATSAQAEWPEQSKPVNEEENSQETTDNTVETPTKQSEGFEQPKPPDDENDNALPKTPDKTMKNSPKSSTNDGDQSTASNREAKPKKCQGQSQQDHTVDSNSQHTNGRTISRMGATINLGKTTKSEDSCDETGGIPKYTLGNISDKTSSAATLTEGREKTSVQIELDNPESIENVDKTRTEEKPNTNVKQANAGKSTSKQQGGNSPRKESSSNKPTQLASVKPAESIKNPQEEKENIQKEKSTKDITKNPKLANEQNIKPTKPSDERPGDRMAPAPGTSNPISNPDEPKNKPDEIRPPSPKAPEPVEGVKQESKDVAKDDTEEKKEDEEDDESCTFIDQSSVKNTQSMGSRGTKRLPKDESSKSEKSQSQTSKHRVDIGEDNAEGTEQVGITSNKDSATASRKRDGQPETTENTDEQTDEKQPNTPAMVIAIDIGTTFSGYAYKRNGVAEPIQTAKLGQKSEERVPTILLLGSNESFHSIGNEAKQNYFKMKPTERKEYLYIESFKMALYHQKPITRMSKIKANNNKEVNLMHIFSVIIQHFREHALKVVNMSTMGLTESSIRWVITIPAIWTDSAKQFMREAATNAGIDETKLKLVLEPEAASIYCQDRNVFVQANQMKRLPEGHKYILADLGGGTCDICAHEILKGRLLRELYQATGDDFGANTITMAFLEFCENLFGSEVWQEFIDNYPMLYYEMSRNFDEIKRAFPLADETVTFQLRKPLTKILDKKTEETIEDRINNSEFKGEVTYDEETDELVIKKTLIEKFFQPSVNGILTKIQEVLDACKAVNLKTLVLVGGFSESLYLRRRIEQRFVDLKPLFFDEARFSVLKGAVMMGFEPRSIVERRARFTYGLARIAEYDEKVHTKSLMGTINGKEMCFNIFREIIKEGQILKQGDIIKKVGCNIAKDPDRKKAYLYTALYKTSKPDAKYCRECELVGVVTRKPPPEGWPDQWQSEEQIIVGETEFTVKEINLATGEEYKAQMDFLNE